jgi:hypothetical protein
MGDQVTNNPEALRLLFTEDIYLVQEPDPVYGSAVPGTVAKVEVVAEVEVVPVEVVPEGEAVVSPLPTYVFRGMNQRNILMLVFDEVNEVTTLEGREVFKNIVKSKDLSGNDYAVLNYAAYPTATFEELREFFGSKVILAFGVSAAQLGLDDHPVHRVIEHQGVKMIFSADLHEMSSDKTLKLALWSCLKQMDL